MSKNAGVILHWMGRSCEHGGQEPDHHKKGANIHGVASWLFIGAGADHMVHTCDHRVDIERRAPTSHKRMRPSRMAFERRLVRNLKRAPLRSTPLFLRSETSPPPPTLAISTSFDWVLQWNIILICCIPIATLLLLHSFEMYLRSMQLDSSVFHVKIIFFQNSNRKWLQLHIEEMNRQLWNVQMTYREKVSSYELRKVCFIVMVSGAFIHISQAFPTELEIESWNTAVTVSQCQFSSHGAKMG